MRPLHCQSFTESAVVLNHTAIKPLSLEYQPSPLAALGSVCGLQPSGTAHPLHRKKEGDREHMNNTQQHKHS